MSDTGPTKRVYGYTAVALFVLLAASVAAAYVPLGGAGLVVALAIAVIKTALIGLHFMHVRYSQPIVRVFAVSGLVWLTILFWLTLNDYLTRA